MKNLRLYQARFKSSLYGFMTKLDELDHSEVHQPMKCSNRVALSNFGIKDDQGRLLLNNLNIELKMVMSLLIQGPSGTGKTSLLKAMAGIYPLKQLVWWNILV